MSDHGEKDGPAGSLSHGTTINVRWAEHRKPGLAFLIFGVALPFAVVALEFTTGMCAEEFFDPIPTPWHLALVTFVPLANLLIWWIVRKPAPSHLRSGGTANGIAIGVAFYYTLLFLPLLPFALPAVLIGIGLLPMAPLFSLVAGIKGHFYLRDLISSETHPRVPGTIWGLTFAFLAIVVPNISSTLTHIGMEMASSQNVQERLKGIRLLRWGGDEDLMLRSCYQRRGRATDLMSLLIAKGTPVSPSQAREIYYRVTGSPFNAVAAPRVFRKQQLLFSHSMFDSDLGGALVGGRVEGLSLQSSRIDGSVDADAALAYIEWIMELKNDSLRQREARAQICLPAGGVVSRVTLWIDGEEKEAAFARRAVVREAYQRVVRRRRDPVLVTTNGPDRVLVQCFPVEPGGKTMKLRIGITCPLVMKTTERAFLRLPSFGERNFQIHGQTRHLVWVESTHSLISPAHSLAKERSPKGLYAIRGALTDEELLHSESVIEAERSKEVEHVWAEDKVAASRHVVVQSIGKESESVPESVVLVVDGSLRMQDSAVRIGQALATLPEGLKFTTIVAADDPVYLAGTSAPGSTQLYKTVANRLLQHRYEGGQDSVPALAMAWDVAAQTPRSVIVWVHGPQPVSLAAPEILRQRWERRPGDPLLYDVQGERGPNRVAESLDGINEVRRLPRLGPLNEDLQRLFAQWRPGAERIVLKRRRLGAETVGYREKAKKSSDHLVRLWARDEILSLGSSRRSDARERFVRLAARYHLVTALTGAVVLETARQYEQAGLTPVPADQVPTIPEPETWMLLAAMTVMLLFFWIRRRTPCEIA